MDKPTMHTFGILIRTDPIARRSKKLVAEIAAVAKKMVLPPEWKVSTYTEWSSHAYGSWINSYIMITSDQPIVIDLEQIAAKYQPIKKTRVNVSRIFFSPLPDSAL